MDFAQMFWKMSFKSFRKFLTDKIDFKQTCKSLIHSNNLILARNVRLYM